MSLRPFSPLTPFSVFGRVGGGIAIVGNEVDVIITTTGAVADSLVTTAKLTTGVIGATPGTFSYAHSLSALDHTYVWADSTERRTPLICDGAQYPIAGTKGIRVDLTGRAALSGYEGFYWTPPAVEGGIGSLSVTALMMFNAFRDLDNVQDVVFDHLQINCGGFAIMQQKRPAGSGLNYLNPHGQIEGAISTLGPYIEIEPDRLYSVTLRSNIDEQRCELVVMDGVTGALIGASSCAALVSGVLNVLVQDYLLAHEGETFFKPIAIAWNARAKIPLETYTVPTPTELIVGMTDTAEVTVGWQGVGLKYTVERNKNSAGWTTLTTTERTKFYADTDVTEGDVCQYRVSATIGDTTSGTTAAASITVDADNVDAGDFFFRAGITDATQQAAIAQWIVSAKAAGVWAKGVAWYPAVGGTQAKHKHNIFSSSNSLTYAGAIVVSENGLSGSASDADYADTGIDAPALTANSSALVVYSRTNNTTDNVDMVGGSAGGYIDLLCRYIDNNAYTTNGAQIGGAVADSLGCFIGSRISANDTKLYQDGIQVATGAAPQGTISSGTIRLVALRNIASFGVFAGLDPTESAALSSAVEAFENAVGRSVR